MATTYVTREDIEGMGIPTDALVSPEQRDRIADHLRRILSDGLGLHPEADARLAVATTGRVKSIAIVRSDGTETTLLDGTRINPGDTVTAECDAAGKWTARVEPSRSPTPAAEPQAGETWEEDGWRYALVHPEAGGFAAVATAPNGVKSAASVSIEALARCKRVGPAAEPLTLSPHDNLDTITIGGLAIRCPVVESGDARGFTVRARMRASEMFALQDVATGAMREKDRTTIGANGRERAGIVRKFESAIVHLIPEWIFDVTVRVDWWMEPVPAATWGGIPVPFERVDTARAAAPAKPAALAAGQVWEAPDATWTVEGQDEVHPNFWNARTSIGQRGLLNASMTSRMRYLGTREEIAAAERVARVTASSERMVAKARERADNEVREEAARLGVPTPGDAFLDAVRGLSADTTFAPPTPASPYREAPALPPKAQAIIDECNGIASRMADAWSSPSPGTAAGLRRTIARALDVSPDDVVIHESSPGMVDVEVRGMGAKRVEEAIETMRDHLPLGAAALRVWRPVAPLAALRATIDALIAADHGPFAHARAAALRAWGEQPRPTGLPFTDPAQRLADLRTYEEMRGGGTHPTIRARDFAADQIGTRTVATYERERARSDVYARPSRSR